MGSQRGLGKLMAQGRMGASGLRCLPSPSSSREPCTHMLVKGSQLGLNLDSSRRHASGGGADCLGLVPQHVLIETPG
jgi:hypothetical protein